MALQTASDKQEAPAATVPSGAGPDDGAPPPDPPGIPSPRLGGRHHLLIAFALSTSGGALFTALDLPLPWLLGALAASTAASLAGLRFRVVPAVRAPMIGIIGVMIGSTFTLERIEGAAAWLPSLAVLTVYVGVVGIVIFGYLRRHAGFDRATTFFAATPGGLSEMILLSDRMGADVRQVSLIHATRLSFIVFTIPFLVSFAGPAQEVTAPEPLVMGGAELVIQTLLALLGYGIAKRLRMPNPALLGPLLTSAAVHIGGLVEAPPPYTLLAVAQVVIGTSVGARFAGTPLKTIRKAMVLGVGATLIMLAITCAFAFLLQARIDLPLLLLLVAFIPGGFTEMSLIALAMDLDPAFVVTHHTFRVMLVISVALPLFLWLRRRGWIDRS